MSGSTTEAGPSLTGARPDSARQQQQEPYKLCECGCGRPTLLATSTVKDKVRRGQPNRFLAGHHPEVAIPRSGDRAARAAASRARRQQTKRPFKLCECGCGKPTLLNASGSSGAKKGVPNHYLVGHDHRLPPAGPTKHCPSCKQERPRTEFRRDKGTSDGLNSTCKACVREQAQSLRDRKRPVAPPKPQPKPMPTHCCWGGKVCRRRVVRKGARFCRVHQPVLDAIAIKHGFKTPKGGWHRHQNPQVRPKPPASTLQPARVAV